MRAGRLDRRITLQRKTVAIDGFGEPIETWATLADVWAEMRPIRGTERFVAMQVTAEVYTVWYIRYRSGLTPIDRILYDGVIYDVQGITEVGRRVGLEIMTIEVVT